MKSFGILGAGTWGTALGNMLINMGHQVTIWSPLEKEVNALSETRVHPHLPNCKLNTNIVFTSDLENTVVDKDYIIFATPSVFIRSTAEKIKNYLKPTQILITVAKGIEPKTNLTMSEIINDVVGNEYKVVALSGPTHAEEVAIGLPTLIVSSCADQAVAEEVRDAINNEVLRVYSNTDIKGAEIAGALKNIIALASGMSQGMGFGDNATAALVTRGLAEIVRLGYAMGCEMKTFFGLTGIGDIVVTATSKLSRNHNAGYLLGQGKKLDEVLKEVGMVVEGINALVAAKELSEKYKVELPIVNAVYDVIYNNVSPKDAVVSLFNRKTIAE
ncbi:MAG: NAD(P)-dependent glycerol-3-phosphate dehydrogenase [Bacilli bacterium]|nr:NAD(P)-dependent glycerol-3-phosphate dehydrogenase [Bacilli bacterium]